MKSNDVLEHLGIFASRFVFEFCVFIAILLTLFCVPVNFCKRSSPLRASRKVMRFRLLFHSIRGPEDLQNAIQPEACVQLKFLIFEGVLSGIIRPSEFKNRAVRSVFNSDHSHTSQLPKFPSAAIRESASLSSFNSSSSSLTHQNSLH